MNPDKQAPSWSSAYGSTKRPKLVGQIYFPFDGDELDRSDTATLDPLIDKYIILLLRQRVQLTFEGHCDSRGSDEYNEDLALRRAKAVQDYVDNKLGRSFRFFSSAVLSHGEKYASGSQREADRRVDIVSSFVPKRHIKLPPIVIEGKVPAKQVRRPVQFLFIEFIPTKGSILYSIIVEKTQMLPEARAFAYDMRQQKYWIYQRISLFKPQIQVSRQTIKWRKPETSDTVLKVTNKALEYIRSVAGMPDETAFGLGESSPGLDRKHAPGRLSFYKSWSDYEARGSGEFLKYKNL